MKAWYEDVQFQRNLLWLNGSVPALLLIWDWSQGQLGANPPEAFIRTTGVVALIFLTLSLMATPLSRFLKWVWVMKHRRWLGLWSFYYACLHLMSYSFFDKELSFEFISEDIAKRPFILLGFLGYLLMLPLALTSTNTMIQKMGASRWRALHKLVYPIAILVSIHFWMIVKSDLFWPAFFAGLLAFLLALRLIKAPYR